MSAYLIGYGERGWFGNQEIYFSSFIRAVKGELNPEGALAGEGQRRVSHRQRPVVSATMTDRDIILVASGDSRLSANQVCWPAQAELEATVTATFAALGQRVVRGHPIDAAKGHGFIDGQAHGIEVFRLIDPAAPLVVAEAVWQYSSHVLAGLTRHRGPILTLANWSGQWPGLVGLLNLNGSLTKAGIPDSTIWSEDFSDDFARGFIAEWMTHWSCDPQHLARTRPSRRHLRPRLRRGS